ncbi:hypothetical protein LB505_013226 [Fusarium chuoi]|nr:hypothetical protein LB505_013226 [Fusarium chuoi]
MKRDVLSWLGESSPIDKYEDSLAKRVDTTCEWILERPTFKSWLSPLESSKPSVLWINGPPGFGKTVLCAHIVHRLTVSLDEPVAHFFFTSAHESREDPFAALRSWQRQVAVKSNDAYECIRHVWENDSSEKASRRTLVGLFKQMITAVPGCVFIADGLDECSQLGNGDVSVARFLQDIMGAIVGNDVRLLLVSRDEPEIRQALGGHKEILSEYKIGTTDVQADTAVFSKSVVNRKLWNKSGDLRVAISESMTDRCQGQFLWIKMQEQALRNTMSQKRLREVVENTPSGLDRFYDQSWSRIMNMSDHDRDRTFALLRWTAFTFRPLPIYEVVEAVLIDQFGELDPDDYPEDVDDDYITGEILGLCGPLVEVRDNEENSSPGYGTLHIPHFTVYEYLVQHLPVPLWIQPIDMTNVEREMVHHTVIARACVQYLSLPQVWEEDDDCNRCSKAMLSYVAISWTFHAILSFMDPSLKDLCEALLKSDNILFKSLITYLKNHCGSSMVKEPIFQPQLRPFEHVLSLGWGSMADHLIDDVDVNEIDGLGRSLIFSACRSGSAELVKMLIRHGADLSIADANGLTCLHEAVSRGSEDIVKILVESNVYLSPQDKNGFTPLHLAAAQGHLECYKYLLEKGADATIRDRLGGNAIHYACYSAGHAELLRFVLQNGPDSLATDHVFKVGSPLMLVAWNGDIDMAKVLFHFGAVSSLFVPTPLGELPLQLAASLGHAELVALFLEHGAEKTLSVPDTTGNTALHHACATTERDETIGLLLRPGFEESILMENEEGETPLHVASRRGYTSYAKLILQYSEPGQQRVLKMQNNELQTPLFTATCNGHVEFVKILLEYGAENTLGTFGAYNTSPLLAASLVGSSEIVQEFLSHGAGKTITASNTYGVTPLHAAANANSVQALKLLLEVRSVSVNQKTTYGFSPLFIAARNGYHSIVSLLLSTESIDKDSESWVGLSPLFAAVANGHLEVTKLLLSKGCHAQHWVSIGQDLLWWAQRSNEPELVQILKTQEALGGTDSGSCNPRPGPFTNLEPLSCDAETVDCRLGDYWCCVCTLSVRDDQDFHCVECDDSHIFLCSECFIRGFNQCPRAHGLVPIGHDESESSNTTDGSVDSESLIV